MISVLPGLLFSFWYNSHITDGGVKPLQDKKPKFMHIATWGCQMNDHDSEVMRALLEQRGLSGPKMSSEADVVVLNTCSVRKSAEQKVTGFSGDVEASQGKPSGSNRGGRRLYDPEPGDHETTAQVQPRQHYLRDTQLSPSAVTDRAFHQAPVSRWWKPIWKEQPPSGVLPAHRDSRIKAYVTIMYGCDNFCSYCVVPYARGREKSRPLDGDLSRRSAGWQPAGYLEVMLLGQNVNSYGKDLAGKVNFAALLERT